MQQYNNHNDLNMPAVVNFSFSCQHARCHNTSAETWCEIFRQVWPRFSAIRPVFICFNLLSLYLFFNHCANLCADVEYA